MPNKGLDQLVDDLVERGYIESKEVEEAFRKVPREEFVPPEVKDRAYRDTPLNIGEGQTISAPHMVATMTELLNLEQGHQVLEVGTGRGYHAAITAEIVGDEYVYTIERHRVLAGEARENLDRLGYGDVTVGVGDGSLGLPEYSPYDRIYVTCAAPEIPDPLTEQLRDGGRLVIPVGRGAQTLYTVDKHDGGLQREGRLGVRFVRLVGEEGY